MDRITIMKYFEKKFNKEIDGNGSIKVEIDGKLYRYKFKDRVVALQYKDPIKKKWLRADSFFYSDVDGIIEGKLKIKGRD